VDVDVVQAQTVWSGIDLEAATSFRRRGRAAAVSDSTSGPPVAAPPLWWPELPECIERSDRPLVFALGVVFAFERHP